MYKESGHKKPGQLMSDWKPLKPPFPWFGGKSRVSKLVWERFGDVKNYVEPFFGSGAVLFGRPSTPKTETVNDLDCYLANFWRATQYDPEAVAGACDWPVNEADLHARHQWLVNQAEFRERMRTDPDYYDAKIAGWWVWGQAAWIGNGWCDSWGNRPSRQKPHLGNAGRGVHRPNQKRPHLGNAKGVHRPRTDLMTYFDALAVRLRRVRVCCGDWSRVCSSVPTTGLGLTGIFFDPPYGKTRAKRLYACDSQHIYRDVQEWCAANGENPLLRIALCGYEGEWEVPKGWETVRWKAQGGYGNQGDTRGRENKHRERIWFSPACLGTRPRPKRIVLRVT